VVPTGVVRFNFIDLREQSDTYKERVEITLSIDNYLRITVPPKILFGFKGLGDGSNIVANIADMVHTDEECTNIDINKYEFK
jgi:dTDP-4-dehydrorhamnose 3,5-epimerase